MNSQKRFSNASFLISTKYLQNIIILFCLELQYAIQKRSTVVDSAIQLSAEETTYF
jgi:hypothetical protein